MTTGEKTEDRAKWLLTQLAGLRDDRGAMANLRRGLSAATEERAWPWVARWCDLTNERQRTICTTIAAAFASHPETTDRGNLGLVMRQIAQSNQKGEEGLRSFEARFRRLLACHSSREVCQRLPNVIHAAAQRGIAINYEQLYIDLCWWDNYGGPVKVRWAAMYWGGTEQGA